MNFDRVLEYVMSNSVDLLIHGGDIFYRSKVPGKLVDIVFSRLHRVADAGIPIYMVPGNHERSAIPYRLLAEHPNIFFFDQPVSYIYEKHGVKLCLAGFPSERNNVRSKFTQLLQQTSWREQDADMNILCLHQSIDGTTTGPHNFTFRYHRDVIDIRQIPQIFNAVITGHMHKYQVIMHDLQGRSLSAPVFYPGSIERTSFAEKSEQKGFLTLDLDTESRHITWQFHGLPARPMVALEYNTAALDFKDWLSDRAASLPQDAILRISISGNPDTNLLRSLRAESLRRLLPDTMNVGVWLGSGITKT